MREDQRVNLENKKKVLHQKLLVEKEIYQLQQFYIPFLEKLPRPFNFEYFQCVAEENKSLWLSAIENPPLSDLSIPADAIKVCDQSIHEKMMDAFPGYLPLRYMPCLPFHIHLQENIDEVLPGAIKSLGVKEKEEVYLFFTRHQPVLRISITDILRLNEDDFPWSEDLCILSKDLQWLIFRSLEDEWRWGTKAMENRHFNPGENLILIESGVESLTGMRKVLASFENKYGLDYNDDVFNLKYEMFVQSGADEMLVVWKGKDIWMEVMLKKDNCEWKIVTQ